MSAKQVGEAARSRRHLCRDLTEERTQAQGRFRNAGSWQSRDPRSVI